MSRISKFAARDTGPSARIVGFFSHLRFNNLKLGVSEVETALTILDRINMSDPCEVRRSLKPLCVGNLDESRRFEDLFDNCCKECVMGLSLQTLTKKNNCTHANCTPSTL